MTEVAQQEELINMWSLTWKILLELKEMVFVGRFQILAWSGLTWDKLIKMILLMKIKMLEVAAKLNGKWITSYLSTSLVLLIKKTRYLK